MIEPSPISAIRRRNSRGKKSKGQGGGETSDPSKRGGGLTAQSSAGKSRLDERPRVQFGGTAKLL